MKLKHYPGWQNALNEIVRRVKKEGYGVVISHEQIMEYLDIKKPEVATQDQWQKFQFEMLGNLDKLRNELLINHNMYLDTIIRVGYQILKPNDQVKQAPSKHLKRAAKQIRSALMSLTFVDTKQLDSEHERVRLRGLEKIAFLKLQMSKKVLAEASIE